MTTKTTFSEQEWDLVLSGPPSAGMMVITAHGGGMMRESVEMAKVYAEARKRHGDSELLDEIVSTKPQRDHTHYASMDELRENTVARLGEAVALLESKATAQEAEDYRRFILTLVERVARRHKEDGVEVSPPEQAAIDQVAAALSGS